METKQPQMGSGMAQGAAEVMAMMPSYRLAKADAMTKGESIPEFKEWLILQRAQNAPKILPR